MFILNNPKEITLRLEQANAAFNIPKNQPITVELVQNILEFVGLNSEKSYQDGYDDGYQDAKEYFEKDTVDD